MSSPPDDKNPPGSGDPSRRPEKRLGKYRLIRTLGRGGMGVVYEAEDTLLKRQVAIKVLSSRIARDQSALQRFLREAQATAKLAHPHVVAIHEIDEKDGLWFIAMEYLSGGSLADLVGKKGALPWMDATRAVAEACQGLMAAHQVGLIHRDIKPANLMRTSDGHVKLVDFGLAKVGADVSGLTVSGVVVGTPHFMSPEQWRAQPLDDLSDIYSLGATYYALVTGQPPFARREPLQVMFACCSEPPPDPRRLVPTLPESCVAIIQRAMAREPSERYANASAMLVDLSVLEGSQAVLPPEALQAPTQTMAPTPTVFVVPPPVSRPTARRRPAHWSWALGGLVLLTLIVLGLANWLGSSDPVQQPPVAKPTVDKPGLSQVSPAAKSAAGAPASTGQSPSVSPSTSATSGEWQPLWNGRDLTGWWKLKSPPGEWTVEDGAIVGKVKSGGSDPSSYLFTDRRDFGDFELRLECRVNAGGNSGVFFRCDSDASLPRGLEAHVATNYCGDLHRTWQHQGEGPERSEGRGGSIVPDAWQQLSIVARGRQMSVTLNGRVVCELTEREGGPAQGHIGLQVFGDRDTEVAFRRLEIREFP